MCGKNKSCGCSTEERAAHEAANSEVTQEQSTEAVVASGEGTAVVAAGEVDEATGLASEWHAVLCVEGLRTTDHRLVSPMALTWRQLPFVIDAQFENVHGYGDTPAAAIVGSVTEIERVDNGNGTFYIMGKGTWDLGSEAGREAARKCQEQLLRWNSVDLEILASEYVEVSKDGGGYADPGLDIIDILFDDEASSEEADWYTAVTDARIMKTTMVSTPAFPQCVMAPVSMTLDIPEPMGTASQVTEGLLASAGTIPDEPPAAWFEDPQLDGPTPLEVTDEGRVFGHLALWDTCHIGMEGVCVTPPQSQKAYAYFKTGRLKCAGGEEVSVGQITFNTGHAATTLKASDTTHHYDHTGSVAADITVGEDEFGIWFAGALRPGLAKEDIRAVRAAPLSGDWRQIGGNLELVAALAVNVPGFPIVAAGQRQGEQVSLIAAAVKRKDPVEVIARELATLRRAVTPLLSASVVQLQERVNGKRTDQTAVVASLQDRVNAAS